MIHIGQFVSDHVTARQESMFLQDIEKNRDKLTAKISHKRMLVIGGAGSIGSSFIKAVLPFGPSGLVVADTDENALAELTRDLRSSKGMPVPDAYKAYPIDFASGTFQKMFRSHGGFDIVANFSAHKHVRSEKDIYSIEALLANNLLHAQGLLDLLEQYPPEEYFCVSTDKAANPVNIMGASKRVMEDLIFCYSGKFPVKTARFANVAFSNGSLLAGFLARIGKRQPLSAPSDIKRYFVSLEESGQICMLACMLGQNREVFFPKLEEAQMMSFDAVAVKLLQAYGYEALECGCEQEAIEKAEGLRDGSRQYPVYFSASDTSGEKPFEEFYTEKEHADMGRFHSLGVITGKEMPDKNKVMGLLGQLEDAFERGTASKEEVVGILKAYLPNFGHIETGKSLDDKM